MRKSYIFILIAIVISTACEKEEIQKSVFESDGQNFYADVNYVFDSANINTRFSFPEVFFGADEIVEFGVIYIIAEFDTPLDFENGTKMKLGETGNKQYLYYTNLPRIQLGEEYFFRAYAITITGEIRISDLGVDRSTDPSLYSEIRFSGYVLPSTTGISTPDNKIDYGTIELEGLQVDRLEMYQFYLNDELINDISLVGYNEPYSVAMNFSPEVTGFKNTLKVSLGKSYSTEIVLYDYFEMITFFNDGSRRNHESEFFLINDEIYYGGGQDTDLNINYSDLFKYNTSNDEWSKVQDIPDDVSDYAMVLTNENFAYVANWSTNIYQYNPLVDSWTKLEATFPNASDHTWHEDVGIWYMDKFYATNGSGGCSLFNNYALYDPSDNSWSFLPCNPISNPDYSYIIEDKIYYGNSENFAFFSVSENQWSEVFDYSFGPFRYGEVFGFYYDGQSYLIGSLMNNYEYCGQFNELLDCEKYQTWLYEHNLNTNELVPIQPLGYGFLDRVITYDQDVYLLTNRYQNQDYRILKFRAKDL